MPMSQLAPRARQQLSDLSLVSSSTDPAPPPRSPSLLSSPAARMRGSRASVLFERMAGRPPASSALESSSGPMSPAERASFETDVFGWTVPGPRYESPLASPEDEGPPPRIHRGPSSVFSKGGKGRKTSSQVRRETWETSHGEHLDMSYEEGQELTEIMTRGMTFSGFKLMPDPEAADFSSEKRACDLPFFDTLKMFDRAAADARVGLTDADLCLGQEDRYPASSSSSSLYSDQRSALLGSPLLDVAPAGSRSISPFSGRPLPTPPGPLPPAPSRLSSHEETSHRHSYSHFRSLSTPALSFHSSSSSSAPSIAFSLLSDVSRRPPLTPSNSSSTFASSSSFGSPDGLDQTRYGFLPPPDETDHVRVVYDEDLPESSSFRANWHGWQRDDLEEKIAAVSSPGGRKEQKLSGLEQGRLAGGVERDQMARCLRGKQRRAVVDQERKGRSGEDEEGWTLEVLAVGW